MTAPRLAGPPIGAPARSAGSAVQRGMMGAVDERDFRRVLAAARRHDDAAWRVLFRLVSGRVMGFLVSRGCPDPEGVAGDVFADMVRSIRRFRGDERGFVAWTLTIAHRRLVDAWRAASSRPVVADDDTALAGRPAPADTAADALGLVAAARARRLIASLTPDQADVVLLRIYGDLTLPEVARHLGKPLTAVTALQHRALAGLRRLMEGEPDL